MKFQFVVFSYLNLNFNLKFIATSKSQQSGSVQPASWLDKFDCVQMANICFWLMSNLETFTDSLKMQSVTFNKIN